MLPRRAKALLSALAAACLLGGCGLGAGNGPQGISLVVTREFGAHEVPLRGRPQAVGEETVMSLLMRNFNVTTRYDGGFVESVNGLSGGHEANGDARDWFYFVNGTQAAKGAAETKVHPGDAIWWDLHDWSQAEETPAVVGSFPQPFLSGIEGKRLPVRVECASIGSPACTAVVRRLTALGVPAGISQVSPGGETPDTLRVAVGPWRALQVLLAASTLTRGPRASGVYAQIIGAGKEIDLLNAHGAVAQRLQAGGGLIAAVRYSGEDPLWLVTGTDAAGANAAAQHFDSADLDRHFAIAIPAGGAVLPLPDGP